MLKQFTQYIFIALLVLFIVGIFMSLYTVFFVMPESILLQVGISQTDQSKLEFAKLAAFKPILLVAGELLLGLILMIILIVHNKKFSTAENIVYVTRTETNQREQDFGGGQSAMYEQENLQQQIEDLKQTISNQTDSRLKLQVALNGLCNLFQATIGAVYIAKEIHSRKYIEFVAGYAFQLPESQVLLYEYGEGLAGQVAKDGREINISHVPDGYITVVSGLGKSTPSNMIVIPIHQQQQVVGVLEIASFLPFTEKDMTVAREITKFMSAIVHPEIKGVVLAKS